MTNLLLIFSTSIIIYEFIKFIKFIEIIKSNIKIYKKISKLFYLNKTSDFRKQKLIFIYSKLLMSSSLKIFFVIFLILALVYSINLFSNSFLDFLTSILGLIELTIVFIIYHFLRKKLNA